MRTLIPTFKGNERTAGTYTCTIKDGTGTAIPAASLTGLTLTLEDVDTGTIINSRSAQSVLNENNVTVDSDGLLTWQIQPADMAIVGTIPHGSTELHRFTFKFSYSSSLTAYVVRDIRVVSLSRAS